MNEKVREILSKREPARASDRVRQIWPDIVALHEHGLLYKQIAELLPEFYGFAVSYKTFVAICRKLRVSPPAHSLASARSEPTTPAGRESTESIYARAKAFTERDRQKSALLSMKG